jgi:hypothetical protein
MLKRRNSIYILLGLVALSFASSCNKRNKILVDDYIETRHTVRFLLEMTTVSECFTNYLINGKIEGFTLIEDGNPATPDTLILDRGPYNNDARMRYGSLIAIFTGDLNGSTTEFEVSFDYTRDSMRITGNFLYKNTVLSTHKIINGQLNFSYINDVTTTIDFDAYQIFVSGSKYTYTCSFEGNDSQGNSYSGEVDMPLQVHECNDYGTDNNSIYKTQYIQKGNVLITNTKQGEGGVLWFGYNGTCDSYAVVLWEDKDIQLNIDMVNY